MKSQVYIDLLNKDLPEFERLRLRQPLKQMIYALQSIFPDRSKELAEILNGKAVVSKPVEPQEDTGVHMSYPAQLAVQGKVMKKEPCIGCPPTAAITSDGDTSIFTGLKPIQSTQPKEPTKLEKTLGGSVEPKEGHIDSGGGNVSEYTTITDYKKLRKMATDSNVSNINFLKMVYELVIPLNDREEGLSEARLARVITDYNRERGK